MVCQELIGLKKTTLRSCCSAMNLAGEKFGCGGVDEVQRGILKENGLESLHGATRAS